MGRCPLATVEGRALGGAAAECTHPDGPGGAAHASEVAEEARAAGSPRGDLGWMMAAVLVVGFWLGVRAGGRFRRGGVRGGGGAGVRR